MTETDKIENSTAPASLVGRLVMPCTNICPKCESVMSRGTTWQTCVGFVSPPGHNHDDNCVDRTYTCSKCKFEMVVSKQNSCPACDWKGRKTCWCHTGEKVEEWPVEIEA